MTIQNLIGKRFKSVGDVDGYTQQSKLPMALMFAQPNNAANYNFKMEDASQLLSSFNDLISERAQSLDFVMRETLIGIKSFFTYDSNLVYNIEQVPYTTLAKVDLVNVIGLKCDLRTYIARLAEALEVAVKILEFELPAIQKLVGQLISNKDALTSLTPISALTEIKMYTQDTERMKNELSALVGPNHTKEFVKFGESYYSMGEWKNAMKEVREISNRLKKINVERFGKDVKNLTALMDRLIMVSQRKEVPQSNIETYSKVIETSSNNIAFAGAVVHMCETLLIVVNDHNKVLNLEVDDYIKMKK